ncbi:hypothetical protein D5282_13070 [bacterium 1xD8-48]|jgi:Uncharacterized conserved protein|nr:hypothetical protein [Lachnospiraceae bacterium]NBJ98227.1 hypothetical protein [bacterium 1xD8-48]
MSDFLKGLKANYTISAGLCTLLGLVLLIWPGTTMRIVCTLLGSMLLIYGLAQVVLYLINKERTMLSQGMMVFGIVLAVIGIWILTSPEMIIMAVPVIVGVLIVIHGVHNVVQAIALKKDGYDRWWLAFLFGALTVVLGGILVYNPFEVAETVVRFIGIFLIYDGVSDIWILSRVFKVKRDKEKIIDVDYVDVEE